MERRSTHRGRRSRSRSTGTAGGHGRARNPVRRTSRPPSPLEVDCQPGERQHRHAEPDVLVEPVLQEADTGVDGVGGRQREEDNRRDANPHVVGDDDREPVDDDSQRQRRDDGEPGGDLIGGPLVPTEEFGENQ